MTLSASLLLGALLGAANAAVALLVARRARTMASDRALRVVLGGMMVRMVVVLAAFALLLALVPVQRGPFVLGLGVVFGLGLLAEVFLVLGRPPAGAPRPPAADA